MWVVLAGLLLWTGCLQILWGWSLDSSGAFAAWSLLLWLVSVWSAFRHRQRWGLWGLKLLRIFNLRNRVPLADALADALGNSKEDAQRRMQLLSAAAVFATGCYVVSTLWIVLAGVLAGRVAAHVLLSDGLWRLVESALLLIGWLPAGVGVMAAYMGSVVARESGGRDTYAGLSRDWLLTAGLGAGALGVAWWFGANLVYVAFAAGGAMVLSAVTGVSRMELSTHPRKKLLPFGPPGRWQPVWIGACAAGLLLTLIVQLRILHDVFGLSLTRRGLWVLLSLGLMVFFLDRLDRKGKQPGRAQRAGAVIGIGAGVLIQAAEWLALLRLEQLPSIPWWMVIPAKLALVFPIATQIPLACMAATLWSYHRREFASAGGSAGAYLSACWGGLACGLLGWMILASWTATGTWIVLLLAGLVLGGGIRGARLAATRPVRIAWLSWSAALGLWLVVGTAFTGERARRWTGPVDVGVGLTARGRFDDKQAAYTQYGYLPLQTPVPSSFITDCLSRATEDGQYDGLFARRRGQWWCVAGDARNLPAPDDMPPGVYLAGASPEAPALGRRWQRRPGLSSSNPQYQRYARLNVIPHVGPDNYDSIYLAPLPADHPQAWRVFNEQLLDRCQWFTEFRTRQEHTLYGLFVLRAQADAEHVRSALRVARTYHNLVRSGWALVAIGQDGLDLLLLGPEDALLGAEEDNVLSYLAERIGYTPDVFLVPIHSLWSDWENIQPIRLANPPGERLRGTPGLKGLRTWLEVVQKTIVLPTENKEQSPALPE